MRNQTNEKEMTFIESHIPELAEVAFKQAFWQTLADGVSVMIAENNQLVELFPDGTKKVIKDLSQSGFVLNQKIAMPS
jgi:hypothetical protein